MQPRHQPLLPSAIVRTFTNSCFSGAYNKAYLQTPASKVLFCVVLLTINYLGASQLADQGCSQSITTAACSGSLVNFAVFSSGVYPGIDCTTRDLMEGVPLLGLSGFEEWEAVCRELPAAQSDRPSPPRDFETKLTLTRCTTFNNRTVDFTEASDLTAARKRNITLKCKTIHVRARENFLKCIDVPVSVCTNGNLDYSVFDIGL